MLDNLTRHFAELTTLCGFPDMGEDGTMYVRPHRFGHCCTSFRLQTVKDGVRTSPFTVVKELGHTNVNMSLKR